MSETTTSDDDNTWRTFFNVTLWLFQLLLATAFGLSGFLKMTGPMEQLVEAMTWAENLPAWLVRFIGVSEVLGAAGLILPAITKIKPTALTVAAAAGLAIVMLLAALFHIWRLEFVYLPVNLFLGGAAVFIVWGRLNKAPFEDDT